jgi:2'-5' RNA ligase
VSLRTALSIVLDDPRLAEVRAHFDPVGTAAGIPLHITLLFPFVAPEDVAEKALEAFFGGWSPMRLALTRVEEFPGVLWLAPEPTDELRARTHAVYERFPNTPPYGGEHTEAIPHATVGKVPEGASQPEVAAAVRAAAEPLLPVEFDVSAVSLLAESAPDRWRIAREFALQGGP